MIQNLLEVNEVVKKLRATSSPIEKKKILSENQQSVIMSEVLLYTYNPYHRYWIRYDKPFALSDLPTGDWFSFRTVLNQLMNRQITGGMASVVLEAEISRHPLEIQPLLAGIVNRDLSAGIGIQTIIDVYGDGFIPVFNVMKAKKLEDQKLTFPRIIEPKLDGVRCYVVKCGETVTLWSRRGHVFENYPQVIEDIKKIPGDFILDGELVQKDFNKTMSQVRRKYEVDTSGTVLTAFDMLPFTSTISTSSVVKIPLVQRLVDLNKISNYVGDHLELIPSYTVYDLEGANKLYSEFLVQGYEGAMLKDPQGFYWFKRHNAWLKMKPTDTLDLRIIDFVEGEGKYVGLLGALVVELWVRTGLDPLACFPFEVNVGGGFSDLERADFWNTRQTLIGKIIEVKYDRVTTNEQGGYSLRFPRFVKLRPDKLESDVVDKPT